MTLHFKKMLSGALALALVCTLHTHFCRVHRRQRPCNRPAMGGDAVRGLPEWGQHRGK
mgnify:CR=1 FL=1